jgi:hypothetical protein
MLPVVTAIYMPVNLIDVYTAHHGVREPASVDSPFQPDRRKRTRTRVHWPLLLMRADTPERIETVTQNLSSSGFYCLSSMPLMPGETLRCTLRVPAYDPKSEQRTISLECSALVLRAEAMPDGLFGLACRIEDYHLVEGPHGR